MYFESISILSGFIILSITLWFQGQREEKQAMRELYQNLELSSNEVFRFEADHMDLIRPIWEEGCAFPEEGTAEYTSLQSYVCQILNLFEIMIHFHSRNKKIMPEEIFKTWIAWFYDLSSAPGFAKIWPSLESNYSDQLSKIMSKGLEFSKELGGKKQFLQWLASR